MTDCVSSIFPLALVPSKILFPSKFRSCVECGKVWVSISANRAESASLLPQVGWVSGVLGRCVCTGRLG